MNITEQNRIIEELKINYPELYLNICKDLNINLIENENKYINEVFLLKNEYPEIYDEICNYLYIDFDEDINNLKDFELSKIISTLKLNYRTVWKEL
jgi:aspartate carbamoyltransferase regulatory subunit